eukprot:26125-Eustigmatos_ZCMA.PRE.1
MAAGNVARACTLLLKVLYVVPELLPELETELAEAIRAYTAQLVRANKAKQVRPGGLLVRVTGRLKVMTALYSHLRGDHALNGQPTPRCPRAVWLLAFIHIFTSPAAM